MPEIGGIIKNVNGCLNYQDRELYIKRQVCETIEAQRTDIQSSVIHIHTTYKVICRGRFARKNIIGISKLRQAIH